MNTTIITKKPGIILPIMLIVIAALFRLWRISELTEFLGDQGRTGMVIYDAWKTGILPLAGPTVLSGQHLGPFFYYLIGPAFILGRFNPIVPSVFIALLGVASVGLLFVLGKRLFGFWIGWGIALLYAVAAYLIPADRTIWEPTVIPFFVLLYTLCVYELVEKRNYWSLLAMGILVGILVQLHYPMVFFIGLSSLLYVILFFRKGSSKKTLFVWLLAGIGGFVFVFFPFLLYEAQHGWVDIREIVFILAFGGSGGQASLSYAARILDASSKIFGYLAPGATRWFIVFLQLFVVVAAIWRRTFWSLFFAGWYALGIVTIAMYRGVVFDHYLFFLLPVAYLLLGQSIWSLRRLFPMPFMLGFMSFLVIINVQKTDLFLPVGNNDISRVRNMANEILMSAKNQPFSFTLIHSRSFSDLHYRYFFKLAGIEPRPITDAAYGTLFLVCDQFPCPSKGEMMQKRQIQAMCFEPHCKGTYPTIDLSSWKLTAALYAPDGRIFMYTSSGVKR